MQTADLCDQFTGHVRIVHLPFIIYGKKSSFQGEVVTLKLFEDNTLVRKTLEENGEGKVLVIDGGGSNRCALVGDNLAKLAMDNLWAGLLVYGCIRDSAEIGTMDVAIKALGTCPVKSKKNGEGQINIALKIDNTTIKPGDYIYSDADGVVITNDKFEL